jgi:hypothetical protein
MKCSPGLDLWGIWYSSVENGIRKTRVQEKKGINISLSVYIRVFENVLA